MCVIHNKMEGLARTVVSSSGIFFWYLLLVSSSPKTQALMGGGTSRHNIIKSFCGNLRLSPQ